MVKTPVVVISIDHGLIETTVKPSTARCRVVVRDYDVDGVESRDLSTDSTGRRYLEEIHDFGRSVQRTSPHATHNGGRIRQRKR